MILRKNGLFDPMLSVEDQSFRKSCKGTEEFYFGKNY